MNQPDDEPILGEFPLLPREELGPFLILGVDKDVGPTQIEARAARRSEVGIPQDDIRWAREVLSDASRRLRADAESLDIDTAERTLRNLAAKFGLTGTGLSWSPVDVE